LLEANADRELAEADIHLWQNINPVVTEALIQLTWGGPQVVYNGGAQQAQLVGRVGHRIHPPRPQVSVEQVPVGDRWLEVVLPPRSQLTLSLELALHSYQPSYRQPGRS
jgi:hypothetical protein